MVILKTPWRQDTECPEQDLDAQAARRDGHRAPELQPRPNQAGGWSKNAASAASAATHPQPNPCAGARGRQGAAGQGALDPTRSCRAAPKFRRLCCTP